MSILAVANVILRRWRAVGAIALLAAAITAVISIVVPPTYVATTTFAPETRTQNRLPTGLAGLAGQFGIPLGIDASQSPRFYAEVAKSRQILERLLLTKYPDPRHHSDTPDSVKLLEILGAGGKTYDDRLQRGVKALDRQITVLTQNQTNIVRIAVAARYSALAADVANSLVEYLNEFNTKSRQSQARERRKFVQQRLEDGERGLRTAEEELKTFYQLNRSWQQSPKLAFEEGRLKRQVDIQQELYLTLRREFETSRIEEVNDTPVITVIDRATPPPQRASPRRTLLVGVALLLGTLLGVIWAFSVEYVDRLQRTDNAAFRELRGRFRTDLRDKAGQMTEGSSTRTRS